MSLLDQMEVLKNDIAIATLDSRIELYGVTGTLYLPVSDEYSDVYNNYDNSTETHEREGTPCQFILLGDVYGSYIMSFEDIPLTGDIFAIFKSGTNVEPDSLLRISRIDDSFLDYRVEVSSDKGVLSPIITKYKLVSLED